MNIKKWPSDFPKNMVVPPTNAIEIDAHLFRLVQKVEPDADDFLASYKDPKQKHLIRNPSVRKKPGFYGASFFNTHASIKALVEGSPERFDGQLIAEGSVKPEHGKAEYSKHTHHVSVWLYQGIYPKGFKVT